jgi:hypothetical protein
VKWTLATSVLTTVILTGDFYIYLIKDLNYICDSDFLRRRSDIRSDVFDSISRLFSCFAIGVALKVPLLH